MSDFSISELDRKLHKKNPWYKRHAIKLIVLVAAVAWALHFLV